MQTYFASQTWVDIEDMARHVMAPLDASISLVIDKTQAQADGATRNGMIIVVRACVWNL